MHFHTQLTDRRGARARDPRPRRAPAGPHARRELRSRPDRPAPRPSRRQRRGRAASPSSTAPTAPASPSLLAEVDGEIVAAAPIDGGKAVADPFRPTADVVVLLERRARQLRRAA